MSDYDLSKIHVQQWGDKGPRVVMVHGGGQGSPTGGEKNFFNQRRLAEHGWRLIVPDRPGHGESPSQGWPDDAERDGPWVAELLGDGAHLVGHSFGGAVALVAAAMRPEAVKSLTLIEPAAHSLSTSDPRVRKFLLKMMRIIFFTLSPSRRIERILKHLGIPTDLAARFDDPAVRKRMGQSMRRLKVPKKAMLEEKLAAVRAAKIPMLVVTGGWSEAFEVSSGRAAELGGGQHVVVTSPHHFPQIVSDEFTTLLEKFMREAETTRD